MIVCAVRNSELETMEDKEKDPQYSLEKCSYRFLQQTAKSMGLPSNVKVTKNVFEVAHVQSISRNGLVSFLHGFMTAI